MPLPNTKGPTTSEQFKTGALQETIHYTWNTADILGRGATANVYFGRHKSLGDVCAVKVFYDREWRNQTTTRQREIETLQSLDHQNIVKLLALEQEQVTGNVVLVMEYCAGGSVFTMLETPQYAMGFTEEEFRLFLTHICKGLNYLRSKGFIHRDIKPGNIMRFIALDGRSLYKLTDFGAARELQDDETFHSIYGTEEYLFPKMYERAVLRQPGAGNSTFNISVDIWSLGVTIYHVCTGQLPFQPYGGRSNAFTMHEITSKKPSGVISGTQKVQNGPITWNTKLPTTCLLSDQLQEIIVPLLSGLMEVNTGRMWAFDTCFKHVEQLDSLLVIKVFFCGTGQLIQLYVGASDNMARIQEKLAMETEISALNQLLLYNGRDVRDCVDVMAPAHTLERGLFKDTLNLYNKTSMENYTLLTKELPKFPDIVRYENLEADAQTAKKSTALAHYYYTRVAEIVKKQEQFIKAERSFRNYIKYNIRHFEIVLPEISCTLQEAERRLNSFMSNMKIVLLLFRALMDSGAVVLAGLNVQIVLVVRQLEEYIQDSSLVRFFEKIQTRLNEINIYTEVLSRKISDQENERLKMQLGCSEEDFCLGKAEHLKSMIGNVAVTMAKHKKYRDLHSHESFIHKSEKEKLQTYTVNIWSLVREHCTRNLEILYRNVIRETGNLSKHWLRTTKVEQNIFSVKESLSQLSEKLMENEEKFTGLVVKISSVLKEAVSQSADLTSRMFHSSGTHEAEQVSYTSGGSATGRLRPAGEEATSKHAEEHNDSHTDKNHTKTPGSWTNGTVKTNIRSELTSHHGAGSNSAPTFLTSHLKSSATGEDRPKRQRTEMLSLLTEHLTSLQRDSEELKHLVQENSIMMERFLNETSNLRIEGSLDSDQRRYTQDDT